MMPAVECAVCYEPITADELPDVHMDRDGHDVHADCCRTCNPVVSMPRVLRPGRPVGVAS
jgi:hypothetical protein